jgi:hypothetical protein
VSLKIYSKVSKLPKHAFALGALQLTIYKNTSKTESEMSISNEDLHTIDHATQKAIHNAIKSNKRAIDSIEQLKVKALSYHIQCYDEQSISRLFKSRGFEVEATCVVAKDGHLIKGDPFQTGRQIVIVCKKPNK